MRICYWGTFDREYPRNAVLISGLRQNGVTVIECHFELWRQSFRYNKLALLTGFVNKVRLAVRAMFGYLFLIYRYLVLPPHDAVVIGYWGHLDVFVVAAFAKLKRKPLVFDVFYSLYDTAISDWGLAQPNSLLARICHLIDWTACRLATVVLVDTEAQRDFFCHQFGLSKDKVRWLYVGADDGLFVPGPESSRDDPLRVAYVGNYVPLHGVPVIFQAARLLAGNDVEFWFIGENRCEDSLPNDLSSALNPERVKFYPWMEPRELCARLQDADVCLGIFGTSDKANRVIPGKAFLALAMGKPLITGNSIAARELLEDGKNAVLCEMGAPQALADAILRLKNDATLRRRIGKEGRQVFEKHCCPKFLGLQLARLIDETRIRQAMETF